MTEVGLFEAKTRLSELVRQVRAGESFILTDRGKPAAKLTPIESEKPRGPRRIAEAIRRIQAMRKIESVSHEEIRSWIEDGRE
jgi:prevent-host-death family protein